MYEHMGHLPDKGPTPKRAGSQSGESVTLEDALRRFQRWSQNYICCYGGSILFGLSAASILYGIYRIFGPALAHFDSEAGSVFAQTIPAWGALQGYEWAVAFVLLAVVLWRRHYRDAMTLAVLAPLLLGAGTIALSTVANDAPDAAMWISFAALGLGVFRLGLIWRFARIWLSPAWGAGLGVLLGWNYIAGAALAKFLSGEWETSTMLNCWLAGWLALVVAMACFYVDALIKPDGKLKRASQGRPVLQSPALGIAWIFVLTVMTALHQFALRYVFDLPLASFLLAPACVLTGLWALELTRVYGVKVESHYWIPAAFPAWAILVLYWIAPNESIPGTQLVWLWHPALWLLVALGGVAWFAKRSGKSHFFLAALVYLAAFLLCFQGALPGDPVAIGDLNWRFSGGVLVACCVLASVWWRMPSLAVVAIVLATFGVPSFESVQRLAEMGHLGTPLLISATAGSMTIVLLAIIFSRNLHPWILWCAATIAVLVSLRVIQESPYLAYELTPAVFAALLGLGVCWRPGNYIIGAALWVPAGAWYLEYRDAFSGWDFIVLSFLLLVLGAVFSLWRQQPDGQGAALPTNHTG